MKLLALTTSGVRAQLGLFLDGKPLVLENPNPRQHSEWLHAALDEQFRRLGLTAADLTGVAVDLGPGSFTGLRVGFQLAQSFVYANRTPLFTATSSAILAEGLPGRVVCGANAFRNLVYAAEFADGRALREPGVVTAEDFAAELRARLDAGENLTFAGDAFTKMSVLSGMKLPLARELPEVESLARLAFHAGPDLWTHDWKSKTPLYLRGSEAEEKAKIK